MHNFRKTAAAILAVALISSGLPVSGSSSPLFGASLTASAEEQTSTASFKDGVLTLSGNVVVDHVREWSKSTDVKKIVCEEGTVFPENCYYMFAWFKAEEIDLSNADTSAVTNMKSMFYECGNLVKLDISSFNTSKVTTMYQMFGNCSKLEALDLSSFDTSNVKDMSWMFNACKKLSALDVTGFNTSKVTDMSDMFSNCSGLSSIDLSSFDTSSVTTMSGMFSRCMGLTSLDVTGLNTSKVTNMNTMFIECSGLESIDVSKFDTSNVTTMTHMFSKCRSLTSLDLSNFNTSKVTEMAYMFNECNKLKSLDLSSFDTSNVKNMYQMFSSCSSLPSIDVSNFNTANVTDMRGMFGDCQKLTSLDLRSFDTSNVTSMASMFDNCLKLASVDLSSFNTSKVTSMGHMFDDCALTSIDLSNFDTSSVTSMAGMFRRCTALESVNVSSFNTENVTNMGQMFIACLKLKDIDLSGFDMKKVYSKGAMLGGCDKLAPQIIHAVSNSTTLDGTIDLNYNITLCDNLAKIVISGPNGDIKFTDFEKYKQDDGTYKFTYPLNADQSYKTVSLKAYDSNGKKLIVCNSEAGLLDHSQADSTLDSYLEELINSKTSDSVKELASSLRSYCICANEYFHNTSASYDQPAITKDDLKIIEDCKMKDETELCKISLVLNSGTAIRIYYSGDENTAMYGSTKLTAKTSQYGKYFEIRNVKSYNLDKTFTITIGGKKVEFSALSYVQKVYNNPNASEKLKVISNMLYAYGRASKTYKAANQEA